MGCRRHRTGPDSDEIPRRRRAGLVRDNQSDLDPASGSHGTYNLLSQSHHGSVADHLGVGRILDTMWPRDNDDKDMFK